MLACLDNKVQNSRAVHTRNGYCLDLLDVNMIAGCDRTLATGLILPIFYGVYKVFNNYRSNDNQESQQLTTEHSIIRPTIQCLQPKWLGTSAWLEWMYNTHLKISQSWLKTRSKTIPIEITIWLAIFSAALLIVIIVQRRTLIKLNKKIRASLMAESPDGFTLASQETGSQTVISSHASNLATLRSAGLRSWSLYSPFAKATIDVQSDIPVVLQGSKNLWSSSGSSATTSKNGSPAGSPGGSPAGSPARPSARPAAGSPGSPDHSSSGQ